MNLPVVRPEPRGPAWVPAAADPDLDHPRLAATQFSRLLAGVEDDRARLAAELDASHRDTAAAIRDRVEEVWHSLSEPLAHYGITELDDLRVDPKPAAERGGSRRSGPARAGSGSLTLTKATAGGALSRAELAATAKRAHDQCMIAMSRSAELRAESRSSADASVALVTGVGVLAAAGLAVVLRLLTHFAGLPCVGIGIALTGCLVGAASGGGRAVARGGLLGGAVAGIVVLVTAHLAPTDPAAVVGSVVVILLAARFAVGIGAHRPEEPAPPASARARRRR
jgi:hypothetical protein